VLVAILAGAVIATINPIELFNRAQDTAKRNDAAEYLSAFERYYTSQEAFPWNNINGGGTGAVSSGFTGVGGTKLLVGTTISGQSGQAFAVASLDPWAGVVGGLGDSGNYAKTEGVLMSSGEMKKAFAGKPYFDKSKVTTSYTDASNKMYVRWDGLQNINVCYCPQSYTERIDAIAKGNLKCITSVGTGSSYDYIFNIIEGTLPNGEIGKTIANFACLPATGADPKSVSFCNISTQASATPNLLCLPDGPLP
jgi:hypothetical protein